MDPRLSAAIAASRTLHDIAATATLFVHRSYALGPQIGVELL
jgi:hypothetical protein